MKKFTNQRGLAVLEVMIVAAIVAIFATAAVPKMARILDKVQLDYEMKHLYSTMNLARSVGKNSSYQVPALGYGGGHSLGILIGKKNYRFQKNGLDISKHILFNGIEMTTTSSGGSFNQIIFEPNGFSLTGLNSKGKYFTSKSGNVQINSRFGKSTKIYLDSVGRIRGEYDK